MTNHEVLYAADPRLVVNSPNSSSSRNSLFSVFSSSSQATTLSNQSQPSRTFKERLQLGTGLQPQDYYQRPPSPLHEAVEPRNQSSPIPIHINSPTVHICVACNIPFKTSGSLSRHQKQHCERKVEWLCWLCVPAKNFYRKDKLSKHHLDNHGGGCVPGCKKQGGLCDRHLNHSVSEFPPKKAWGCPCCLRCFDTFDAWTKHGGNHPVQNDKIVGWSLSMMVQSLVLQPYLKGAIAHLPWQACDPAKVKADVCQTLREALERHKLPDAVQDHYDYRHLQLPEALAQYAFRLVAYGGPYLDDISTVATKSSAADNATEQLRKEYLGQLIALSPSDPPSSGYWSPDDPFTYCQRARPPTDPASVREYLDVHILDDAFNVNFEINSADPVAFSSGDGRSLQSHSQTLHTTSATLSQEATSSPQVYGSLGRMTQDPSYSERRRRDLITEKPLPIPAHLLSSAQSHTTQTHALPSATAVHDGLAAESTREPSTLDYEKASTSIGSMDAAPVSPRHARMSSRMSFQWEALVDLPEEMHDQ